MKASSSPPPLLPLTIPSSKLELEGGGRNLPQEISFPFNSPPLPSPFSKHLEIKKVSLPGNGEWHISPTRAFNARFSLPHCGGGGSCYGRRMGGTQRGLPHFLCFSSPPVLAFPVTEVCVHLKSGGRISKVFGGRHLHLFQRGSAIPTVVESCCTFQTEQKRNPPLCSSAAH